MHLPYDRTKAYASAQNHPACTGGGMFIDTCITCLTIALLGDFFVFLSLGLVSGAWYLGVLFDTVLCIVHDSGAVLNK